MIMERNGRDAEMELKSGFELHNHTNPLAWVGQNVSGVGCCAVGSLSYRRCCQTNGNLSQVLSNLSKVVHKKCLTEVNV